MSWCGTATPPSLPSSSSQPVMSSPTRLPLPVVHISTKEDFLSQVYPSRHPTVLRGIDLGPAPQLWTPEYLCQKCGGRLVKVHVCPTPRMDFINKNFAYK